MEETKNRKIKKDLSMKEVLDFVKDVIIILIIVFVIRTLFVLPFQINWQSMYDSYYDKEFIIVDRFSYKFLQEPKRWDVIVFRPHVSKEREYFLKRIIWLPWDKIKIEDGKVYIFSKSKNKYIEINEPYLSESNINATFVSWDKTTYEYEIPDNNYFVMWDNRNHSTDSRSCFSSCYIPGKSNFILKSDIIWKILVDLGYFSFSKFKFIHPSLWINTFPKWFSTKSKANYDI